MRVTAHKNEREKNRTAVHQVEDLIRVLHHRVREADHVDAAIRILAQVELRGRVGTEQISGTLDERRVTARIRIGH